MISGAAIGTIHTEVYFSLTPLRNQEAINAKAHSRLEEPTFPVDPHE